MREKVVAKINSIIDRNQNHSKTANHFYRLRERWLNGQRLTKKMQENLSWITKEVLIHEVQREKVRRSN
jgi:hypothetical protein